MKVTVIAIVIGALGTVTKGFGNKRTSGDHLNYSIIENGQTTEKSPGVIWGDLLLLKLMWKTNSWH